MFIYCMGVNLAVKNIVVIILSIINSSASLIWWKTMIFQFQKKVCVLLECLVQ